MQRLASIPHVTHAAYANTMPFGNWNDLTFFDLKRPDGSTAEVQTGIEQVSPDFFATLDQRVVEGRGFSAADQSNGTPIAIVNEAFSRKYLDGKALGWTVTLSSDWPEKAGAPPPGRTIIGIVDDAVRNSVTDAPQPEIYYTSTPSNGASQRRFKDSTIFLVVRTASDPQGLVPTLREIVRSAAPSAPIESVMTMRERVADGLSSPRLYAALLDAFGVFALLIAGVGLFGVLSYSVAQRAREIGVRFGQPSARSCAISSRSSSVNR